MISVGWPSTISFCPIADVLPPNVVFQYPCVRITVSGASGLSAAALNGRPSAGDTPRTGSMLAVIARHSTSRGSARPVIDAVSPRHRPMSVNVLF